MHHFNVGSFYVPNITQSQSSNSRQSKHQPRKLTSSSLKASIDAYHILDFYIKSMLYAKFDCALSCRN
jgi:hypothetical protein